MFHVRDLLRNAMNTEEMEIFQEQSRLIQHSLQDIPGSERQERKEDMKEDMTDETEPLMESNDFILHPVWNTQEMIRKCDIPAFQKPSEAIRKSMQGEDATEALFFRCFPSLAKACLHLSSFHSMLDLVQPSQEEEEEDLIWWILPPYFGLRVEEVALTHDFMWISLKTMRQMENPLWHEVPHHWWYHTVCFMILPNGLLIPAFSSRLEESYVDMLLSGYDTERDMKRDQLAAHLVWILSTAPEVEEKDAHEEEENKEEEEEEQTEHSRDPVRHLLLSITDTAESVTSSDNDEPESEANSEKENETEKSSILVTQ
jgi:hypothetical protein